MVLEVVAQEALLIIPPVARWFVGAILILCVISGAFGFTYWISKDE